MEGSFMALRILSYNILEGGSDRLPFIASVILQQQPDVIALLEARSLPNVEALAQQLGMQSAVGEAGNKNKDNVAWLSRFPIVRAENHPLTLSKTLLEIEIQWEDVPLTLFATHLKAGQNQEREQERIAEMSAIL